MDSTRLDFEERKKEIDNYLAFIVILSDDENTRLKYRKDDGIIEEKISDQLQKILIANGFLLLYNLIEATVRSSIAEIYFEVRDKGITFGELSEKLKKIWIEQTTDSLKEGIFKQDTLNKQVLDIAEAVLKKETVTLLKEKMDFSGNLDAQKIRELAKKFGFETPRDGRSLATIKDKRNRLAHGEYTFSEIGRDFTVKDLDKFKNETFEFLSDAIDKIKDFIINRRYTVTA
jgi:hypothetical protein